MIVKCYKVLYKIRGVVNINADDAQTALNELDKLTVKRILEKSTFENIEVIEV